MSEGSSLTKRGDCVFGEMMFRPESNQRIEVSLAYYHYITKRSSQLTYAPP